MGITEVVSPISRKGSKAGSPNLAVSPGAKSNPSRASGDSVPGPSGTPTSVRSHSEEKGPAETKVVGPEDDWR
jgi:hypothetical protein